MSETVHKSYNVCECLENMLGGRIHKNSDIRYSDMRCFIVLQKIRSFPILISTSVSLCLRLECETDIPPCEKFACEFPGVVFGVTYRS